MQVYIARDVADVVALHPYLADDAFRALPMRNQVAKQAETLQKAHANGDQRVRMHLLSWWPGARGRTLADVMEAQVTISDALLTMSREYGFRDWDEVDALGDKGVNVSFERALDEMLAGDIQSLKSRIEQNPGLVTERSAFGHQATLLHYLGANGVESHRQRTPLNAAGIAQLLVDHGADTKAEANMYGGGQTAWALASSSAHPHKAGIIDQLNSVLAVSEN